MDENVYKGLVDSIKEEAEAMGSYEKLAEEAEKAKQPEIAKLYKHIAEEEYGHLREFQSKTDKLEQMEKEFIEGPFDAADTACKLLPVEGRSLCKEKYEQLLHEVLTTPSCEYSAWVTKIIELGELNQKAFDRALEAWSNPYPYSKLEFSKAQQRIVDEVAKLFTSRLQADCMCAPEGTQAGTDPKKWARPGGRVSTP